MNRTVLIAVLVQILFAGLAVVMGILIEMPWPGILGLVLLVADAVVTNLSSATREDHLKLTTTIGWAGTLMALAAFLFMNPVKTWDNYYALVAWLMSAVIFLTAHRVVAVMPKARWRTLGLVWGFLGSFTWLVASYAQNQPGGFYLGLLAGVVLLILCRLWFRLGALGIQSVNTLILLLIGLPAADLVIRFHSRVDMRAEPAKYYSYEAAQKHPTAYAHWTRYYEEQWARMAKDILEPALKRDPPFRLRPNSRGFLFESPISINQRGFRGREIPEAKGNVYRIVALGESTTFGCTLKREDQPWPELLEKMILERLKTGRPVEVINAGTPAYSLESNLHRLAGEILPLKPDMIISYHGINGFPMIDSTMPPAYGKPPPVYRERPLKILGDFEYAIKLMSYKRHLTFKPVPASSPIARPMETRYAQAYRELIQTARANGIRLVLAKFSMAVNDKSDRPIIDFYRAAYPVVRGQMRANAAHSMVVQQLAAENPDICLVDTQPGLDGDHDKFIDLVHLTQPGRQQLAETFFAGIRKFLEDDLSTREAIKEPEN